jgi:hypothetical protein
MASPRGHRHRRANVLQRAAAAAALLLALSCCCSSADPWPPPPPPPKVPAVIVFGDSTVDTGNNNAIGTVLKSNFAPYGRDMAGGARPTGRFCNGRLPPDFVSEALGLPPLVPAYLDPAYGIQDFARGVCFASAGTGLDNKTAGVLVLRPYLPAQSRAVVRNESDRWTSFFNSWSTRLP